MNIHIRNTLFLILFILSVIGFMVADNIRTIIIYGIGYMLMLVIVLDAFYHTYFAKTGQGVKSG